MELLGAGIILVGPFGFIVVWSWASNVIVNRLTHSTFRQRWQEGSK